MKNLINKIIQGDCLDVMKQIPDKSIDLVLTDPPYLISYKTNYRKDKNHEFCEEIKNDNNPELISNYIKECHRIMKDDTAMYMFCSFDKVDFFKQEVEKLFNIKNIIIWVKNNWTAGDLEAQFGKQYEMIILANKGRKKFNGARITDVWNFKRKVGKEQFHQNEKPVFLLEQAVEKHTDVGEIVFDGFSGSGSSLVAAQNLKRNFIGIELEEKYCEITKQRLRQQTLI